MSASHIWIGAPRSAARRRSTSARFSPACFFPVKKSAMSRPSLRDTIPEVKTPLRSLFSLPARARLSSAAIFLLLPLLRLLLHVLEDLHRRVVVVDHVALRSLADELLEGGDHELRGALDDVPLGRVGKRNPQVPLETLEGKEGPAPAVGHA